MNYEIQLREILIMLNLLGLLICVRSFNFNSELTEVAQKLDKNSNLYQHLISIHKNKIKRSIVSKSNTSVSVVLSETPKCSVKNSTISYRIPGCTSRKRYIHTTKCDGYCQSSESVQANMEQKKISCEFCMPARSITGKLTITCDDGITKKSIRFVKITKCTCLQQTIKT